jgi:bifunctional ADP-heptose synthase (sugar kinase/adenylyltransferase)
MNQPPKPLKILLIGDDCVDVYNYGVVERISPEAPVPIFKSLHTTEKKGMASNVKENLEAVGCEVVAYLGKPSTKTRLVDIRSNQHITRIDNDAISSPCECSALINHSDVDAVVISDYNKGFITYDLIEGVNQAFNDIPIFVDTKKTDLARMNTAFVKINELEASNMKSTNGNIIVTMGVRGARYNTDYYPTHKVDVVDVCGAGDTFLAALAYKMTITKNIKQSIEFANKAACVTVQHMGTYAPALEEIENV